MIRSRLGLKLLGLCALALGLMAALGSSAAQAEPGAFWLVNGAKISTELLPKVGLEIEKLPGTEIRHAVLLTTFQKKAVEILCENAESLGIHLVEPNGGTLGQILFTGCKELVWGGVKQPACVPSAEHITTDEGVTGLIVLHEYEVGKKEELVKFTPGKSGLFATIHMGELCAMGENIPIGGTFFIKDCNLEFLVDKKVHLIEEQKTLTKLWAFSNTEEHKATIDGSANVFLTGTHEGATFAGHF